jgi:hypothetical protein
LVVFVLKSVGFADTAQAHRSLREGIKRGWRRSARKVSRLGGLTDENFISEALKILDEKTTVDAAIHK